MVTILPFRALCPDPSLVAQIASPPYDVLSTREARAMAADKPNSFLHIIKPEIDLQDTDPYADAVYRQGAINLRRFTNERLLQEHAPSYYLYQQIMGQHVQTGIVGVASIDEYDAGVIKKHEFTRPEKVNDRVRLISALNAQTGPVFLAFRQTKAMADLITLLLDKSQKMYDFSSFNNVRHIFYKVEDASRRDSIRKAFAELPALYIADGHHRSEGAATLCRQKRQQNANYTGKESFNYFLSVTFPHSDLLILAYNRVVRDLNNQSLAIFLKRLEEKFIVAPEPHFKEPDSPQKFGMYVAGQWYELLIKKEFVPQDPVDSLDASLLQEHLLRPILNIDNPRTNKRIDFIGGIRGARELQRLVDSGDYAVAFALHPTSMQQVMAVADAGRVMPPKSTWFEPKLLSGLATHLLD
ncbi:DUF1015 domain-containing protein [candidate division KSB1 bacterium]|nr:DUF1015 domain-containing protein [candidate division KSB1 bacterium]RQW09617.1 MAG: DUF1015 domain-containing protein [candidate division KSB1 bacterium]